MATREREKLRGGEAGGGERDRGAGEEQNPQSQTDHRGVLEVQEQEGADAETGAVGRAGADLLRQLRDVPGECLLSFSRLRFYELQWGHPTSLLCSPLFTGPGTCILSILM